MSGYDNGCEMLCCSIETIVCVNLSFMLCKLSLHLTWLACTNNVRDGSELNLRRNKLVLTRIGPIMLPGTAVGCIASIYCIQ